MEIIDFAPLANSNLVKSIEFILKKRKEYPSSRNRNSYTRLVFIRITRLPPARVLFKYVS